MKIFKPYLLPNEQPDLDTLNYELLASTKLDGCRMEVYKDKLVTRSLKSVPNKQINEKFEPLRLYTESNNTMMDGEIYAEGIPFYMISSCFMTQDYTTKTAIKKWAKLCEEYGVNLTREEVLNKFKFYMFDCVQDEMYDEPFEMRTNRVYKIANEFPNLIVPVQQIMVHSANDVRTMFKQVLNKGYEGLILKAPGGRYKCGRATIKESLAFKVKPYVTLDAQIIGVKQATKVDPNAPKTTNELGKSVTSKKQADRILIPRAKTFTVNYEKECISCNGTGVVHNGCMGFRCANCGCIDGKIKCEVDVSIGGTEAERDEIWVNKKSYINRWIEYRGLQVGAKDVPRHSTMVRFREDKDE